MKKTAFYIFVVIYTVGIFIGSSISGEQMKNLPPFFLTDKIHHILEFSLWGFLYALAVGRRGLSGRNVLIGMALACLVGLSDELWQGFIQKGRSMEVGDWLGDFLGATLGIIAFYFLRKMVKGDKADDAQPQLW